MTSIVSLSQLVKKASVAFFPVRLHDYLRKCTNHVSLAKKMYLYFVDPVKIIFNINPDITFISCRGLNTKRISDSNEGEAALKREFAQNTDCYLMRRSMYMIFSERTKYTLANSIKELMKNVPLDKITVREIVENCGTTRQTFYRNFRDKYDLVNWYFDKTVQKTIKQMGLSLSLEEGLTKKLEFMKEEKYFFISAFSSSDLNNLFHYDYCCIYEFYKEIAITRGPLTEEIILLLEFYCRTSMEMTADWVRKGMKVSPETMARILVDAMPLRLSEYLSDLSEYRLTTRK